MLGSAVPYAVADSRYIASAFYILLSQDSGERGTSPHYYHGVQKVDYKMLLFPLTLQNTL